MPRRPVFRARRRSPRAVCPDSGGPPGRPSALVAPLAAGAYRSRRNHDMSAIGLPPDHPTDEIPVSHRDLVECPPVAALTTVSADGSPQTSVVWCDVEG